MAKIPTTNANYPGGHFRLRYSIFLITFSLSQSNKKADNVPT